MQVLCIVQPATRSPRKEKPLADTYDRLMKKTMRWLAGVSCVLGVFWVGSGPAAAADTKQPPALHLVMKPHATAGAIDRLDITLTIESPAIAAGQTLLRMPLLIVSTPTARYDGDAISASDTQGKLVLTAVDETPTPTGTYRHWTVDRATVGDVVARYRAPPREVSEKTRNGPLFDLRAEAGGLDGAGISFLALPDTHFPYRVQLEWDLSGLPAGARGVWSLGEGNVTRVEPAETLAFSYYAVGPLKSYPRDAAGPFHLYWLTDPPFDTVELASHIQKFHGFAAKFFHDEGGSYRVFTRRNPYRAGGGTALRDSFMFGYGADKAPTIAELQSMLAHEMTHNWPKIDGEHGDTAWYTEGTAEYYSILLSYRAGVIDAAQFLKEINQRASGYYTNPFVRLTNPQAAEKFWTDSRAQTVPYGRGFMYFARVDAEIRAKSQGKRSLDDIVLDIARRQKKGETIGLPGWVERVTRALGPNAKAEYDDMVAGKLIAPPDTAFAPCLKPEAFNERPVELGFDRMRMSVVKDLQPGSAAEQAGLQEGDEILQITDLNEVRESANQEMVVEVKRGEQVLEVRYAPTGEPVPSYHWVRTGQALDRHCKF